MLCVHNAKLPWLSLALQAMGKRAEKEVSGLSWVQAPTGRFAVSPYWSELQSYKPGMKCSGMPRAWLSPLECCLGIHAGNYSQARFKEYKFPTTSPITYIGSLLTKRASVPALLPHPDFC